MSCRTPQALEESTSAQLQSFSFAPGTEEQQISGDIDCKQSQFQLATEGGTRPAQNLGSLNCPTAYLQLKPISRSLQPGEARMYLSPDNLREQVVAGIISPEDEVSLLNQPSCPFVRVRVTVNNDTGGLRRLNQQECQARYGQSPRFNRCVIANEQSFEKDPERPNTFIGWIYSHTVQGCKPVEDDPPNDSTQAGDPSEQQDTTPAAPPVRLDYRVASGAQLFTITRAGTTYCLKIDPRFVGQRKSAYAESCEPQQAIDNPDYLWYQTDFGYLYQILPVVNLDKRVYLHVEENSILNGNIIPFGRDFLTLLEGTDTTYIKRSSKLIDQEGNNLSQIAIENVRSAKPPFPLVCISIAEVPVGNAYALEMTGCNPEDPLQAWKNTLRPPATP